MLDARRLAHDQAAGLVAWGLHPPLRVVALAEVADAAQEVAHRLAAGCAGQGLDCAFLQGPPPSWPQAAAGDVWLWRADPRVLVRWWPRDGSRPLVPLVAQAPVIVAAYQALKLMHQHGLEPVIVALARQRGDGGALAAALAALRRTCAQYLDWQPTAWTLGYHDGRHPPGEGSGDTAVVTRVLEAAWLLDLESSTRRSEVTC